jgi:hypothetical protein
MRSLSKALLVAVGLFSIGVLSSSVHAKSLLAGSFTLPHPTQWKNTVLPAGNYSFKLAKTDTDTNVLSVHGKNKTLDILIFAQSACQSCMNGALKVDVQNGTRMVTALDLPGYHVDFKPGRPAPGSEQVNQAPAATEQVAVHVNSN